MIRKSLSVVVLFNLLIKYGISESKIDVLPSDVIVVIRNTHDIGSRLKAENMKADLLKQAKLLDEKPLEVVMMHDDWVPYAGWTLLNLFSRLSKMTGSDKKWIFFCEDSTEIHLQGLFNVLAKFDHAQNYFLGHALHDTEPAIIHHFKFYQDPTSFKYPDLHAGWAISSALLQRSANMLKENPPQPSFSIDIKFEVALFLYNDDNGTRLTNIPEFCINVKLGEKNCVSTVNHEEPRCGSVDPNDVLIAVKTCKKFHSDRVPIVQKTVGVHAKNIRFYSDVEESSIPTEYIGVNNTERGHCQKLYNIIKKSADDEWKQIKWLVVIDDDTIMSYKRLLKLLACYDATESVIMGERYGYAINYGVNGYEYPTGGGGMVLSRSAINKILSDGHQCWSVDSPDDMWLGSVSRKIRSPIVNTNSFHQTRPSQYSKEMLSHQYLVSFHKHTQVDPMQVYRDYLEDKQDSGKESHGGEL